MPRHSKYVIFFLVDVPKLCDKTISGDVKTPKWFYTDLIKLFLVEVPNSKFEGKKKAYG